MTSTEKRQAAQAILASLEKVQNWVENHDYKGYEPFDGLSSWARPLALGTVLGDRLLLQLVRQSPLNLRPLLGVSRRELQQFAKALSRMKPRSQKLLFAMAQRMATPSPQA